MTLIHPSRCCPRLLVSTTMQGHAEDTVFLCAYPPPPPSGACREPRGMLAQSGETTPESAGPGWHRAEATGLQSFGKHTAHRT